MSPAPRSLLRRLLAVGTVLLLAGLIGILAFALLNTDSARRTLGRAQDLLRRNKAGDAVELLLLARRSVGTSGDPALRREIVLLSAEAHERVNNLRRALQDVDEVRQTEPGSVSLGLHRIRLLQAMRDPESYDEALRTALALAEAHPGDPTVLAACGECRQTIYQYQIKLLLDGQLAALPSDVLREATELLPEFLYRDATDPAAQRAEQALYERVRAHLGDVQQREAIRQQIEQIRQQIARAIADYRRAMESKGESLSGLRGVSFALIRQGRWDDASLLCEVFCRRFDTAASAFAAERAVAIHRARGHLADAERVARDWQRGRTPVQHFEALQMAQHPDALDSAMEVWVTQARARYDAGDLKAVTTLASAVDALARALHGSGNKPDQVNYREGRMPARYRYLLALGAAAAQDWERAATQLTLMTKEPGSEWHDAAGINRLPEVFDLRWQATSKLGDTLRLASVAQDWVQALPSDPAPLVRQARVLAQAKDLAAARQIARRALALDPADDAILELLLDITDKVESKEGRGVDGIFGRSLGAGSGLVGNLPERAIYLGVARKALATLRAGGLPPATVERLGGVAWRNAQEAVTVFPRAPLARRVLIDACFAVGNERQARAEIEALQRLRKPTVADLEFLRDARTRLGESSDEQLRDLLEQSPGVLALAAPLMERCIERRGFEDAARIGRRYLKERGADPEITLLLGRAEAGRRRYDLAQETLRTVPDASPWRVPALELLATMAAESRDLVAATRHARELVRRTETGAGESPAAASRPAQLRDAPGPKDYPEILWATAVRLAEFKADEAAVTCCEALYEDSARRTPELQTFIARLRFRLGQDQQARRLLEAAVAQKGASEAKLLLASHYAVAGNLDDADEVFNLPDGDGVPASAPAQAGPVDARVGLLIRLGRRKQALILIQDVLRREPQNPAYLALDTLVRSPAFEPTPAREGARTGAAAGRSGDEQRTGDRRPDERRSDDRRTTAQLPPRTSATIADIDALAARSPVALLDLLTLGHLDGFEPRILAALKELQDSHPTNPWALQFGARALAAIGQWQNAIGELGKLIARHEAFYPAYDALCEILARQGNTLVPVQELVANYLKASNRNYFPFSPRMAALTAQLSAVMSGASGNLAAANTLRRTAWKLDPSNYRIGRDLAAEAALGGEFAEAVSLLDRMPDARIPADERIAFFDLYFFAAMKQMEHSPDPAFRTRLRARAADVLRSDGVIGSALHFLMDTETGGEAEFPVERLSEHVLFLKNKGVTPGRDLGPILRSLRILARRAGRPQTLGWIQELLAADPTLFPLWVLRAELLTAEREPEQAQAAIGWILDVIDYPQAALCMVDIAAELGGLDSTRSGRVVELLQDPKPEFQRALGILDWRAGRYAEATRRLAGDAGGKNPIGLYARASCQVALSTVDSMKQAAADLGELARSFADSPWAGYAGLLRDQIERIGR